MLFSATSSHKSRSLQSSRHSLGTVVESEDNLPTLMENPAEQHRQQLHDKPIPTPGDPKGDPNSVFLTTFAFHLFDVVV